MLLNNILFFIFLIYFLPISIFSFDYFDQTVTSTQKQNSLNLLKSKNIDEFGNIINEKNNSFNLPIISNLKMSNLENINIEIQLKGYSNPEFRLPNGRLCTCPKGFIGEHCIQASPQRNGYNCLISLKVFIISSSSSLKYFQTIYNPLNQAGQINSEQFSLPQKFLIDSQPTAIAVLVYNLGPQINSDGNLYETNTVTLVDNFTQPFNSDIRGQQSVSLIGEILGTLLTFTYSVSCAGGTSKDGKRLIGPGCDLNCNTTSKITQNNAICENVKTGYFSQCKWKNGGNLEVNNCQNCPYGIKNNAYCADEQGGVLYNEEVVSIFYYNSFIILCFISGILLILLLLLLICLVFMKRKFTNNNQNKTKKLFFPSSKRDSTTLHNPLLGSELIPLNSSKPEERLTKNIKILPSFNKNEINLKSPPSPFPRSINASTASIPNDIIIGNKQQQQQQRFPVILNQSGQNGKMRKTISPPRFQLLPHLGPQAETDIMNSSFASSCRTTLGPPSVSADV